MRGAFDEAGGLARGQPLLGLAGELRVGHLQAEHEGDPVPHVFRRQLDAARQQVAEVAELAQRIGQARTQAVDVGAVLRGRDQVDVAFLHQLAFRHPGRGPVDDLGVLLQAAREQVGRQHLVLGHLALEVVAQAVLEVPAVLLAGGLVVQLDGQARTQHRLGAQQMAQRAHVELGRVEVLRIGPEAQARAGILLADGADHFQLGGGVAVAELHAVLAAFALDEQLDLGRQRIDHAHAHAMQAAGEGVVAVAELAAGMQPGQDQLDTGNLFFRVHVHRHAAAVVGHLAAAVLVQGHFDLPGVTGQRLVDRVVDHFLRQMVRARSVGIHARAAFDRVQARQHFNIGGVITGVHASRWHVKRRASVGLGRFFARDRRSVQGGVRLDTLALDSEPNVPT